jgi:uncharacterized membrane protein
MDEQEYRERLARDAAAWRRSELITADQEQAILARYGAGEAGLMRALRMGWLVSAISLIGAITLGAGVVLLLAVNWEQMPDTLRAGLVLAGMLASYAIGYVLIYRMRMQRLGSAMLLLGALVFQSGLFLLAQIYNMPVESPILFLLGALGGLPLAYLFGSRIVLLLSLVAVAVWQGWSAIDGRESGAEEWAALVLIGIFAVLLYGVGRLHFASRALRPLGEVYLLVGGVIALALVFTGTFDDTWREIIDDQARSYEAPASVYVLAVFAAVAVAAQVLVRRDRDTLVDVGLQAGLLALALTVATWPAWTGYALVFNAAFFAIAGALIVYGYERVDERYVNIGLAAVGIGLLARYCDTFWSMLTGSAFFIAGGILLLALAFVIERLRRDLLERMAHDDNDAPAPQEVPV